MQLFAARNAFDRRDLTAAAFDREHQARTDEAAVEQHRTGAAVAGCAAFLRAGQSQIVAQHIEHRLLRLAEEFHLLAVDLRFNTHLAHQRVSLARSAAMVVARRHNTATIVRR